MPPAPPLSHASPLLPLLPLQTEAGAGWSNKARRLGDFCCVDEAGIAEPLDWVDFAKSKLFLSGGACALRRLRTSVPLATAHAPRRTGTPPKGTALRQRASPPAAPRAATRPPNAPTAAHPPVLSSPPAAGVVYPKEGPATKDTGRRLARFGPLESISLDYSDKKEVQVGRL